MTESSCFGIVINGPTPISLRTRTAAILPTNRVFGLKSMSHCGEWIEFLSNRLMVSGLFPPDLAEKPSHVNQVYVSRIPQQDALQTLLGNML